ncbi:outer membrane beta-barrel protein [Sphingomonas sp. M6A6_1c]
MIATAWSGLTHAQAIQELPFRDRGRDPDLSVADRLHPELVPSNVRLGSFVATPSLDLGIQHDSNIYALERDPVADVIATASGAFAIRSDWRRHSADLSASISQRQYFKADSESTTDWRLNAGGRLDVDGGTLAAMLDGARQTEARSVVDAPGAADRPVRYHRTGGSLIGERPFGDLTARIGGDWHRYRFEDARTTEGIPLQQSFRNRDIASGFARLDLAVSPAFAVYLDGTVNRRSYGNHARGLLDRDSTGYTIEAGTDFDITRLMRGHVQGGYLSQRGAARRWVARGISGRGRVEWFPKPVLTVTVEGGRRIEDSAQTDTPAYLTTDVAARLDFELLRSLILTCGGSYTWDTFQGLDRRARRSQMSVGARYRMGRRATWDLGYQRLDQHAPLTSGLRNFTDGRLILSVRLQR